MIRFDHVRLDVADLAAAERFYREALGLSEVVRYEFSGGVIVQLAPKGRPPGVELWSESGVDVVPSRTEHVSFQVDDVPAVVAHVERLKYEIAEQPRQIGQETVAFIRDPDGHLIELNDFVGRPTAG